MFLANSESITKQIEHLIGAHSSPAPICIAVAFWGQGAEAMIAKEGAQFQLICNLQAGGTNPHVIRQLRAMAHVDMLQLDTLHAKVVISDIGAVVSSANFSTNGLGLDGPSSFKWLEAGIFVASTSSIFEEIEQWFSHAWLKSKPIHESDLLEAEEKWDKRTTVNQSNNCTTSVASGSDMMLEVQTVHFEGRIKPHQRDLRSAAAILALNGQAGGFMPLSAFVFLFSGGKTRRAFENHQDKFEIIQGNVRLKLSHIGYFVGSNATMESCIDAKRRKSADTALLADTVAWMLRRGSRPTSLEGTVMTASFQRKLSQ